MLCKAKEEILLYSRDSFISLSRLKIGNYSFSMLQFAYVKEPQPDNLFFFFFQYALERSSVNYHRLVFSFSVSSGQEDQTSAVLSCAASLSPWVSLLGRLGTKKCSKEVTYCMMHAVSWTSSKRYFPITLFGEQKFFEITVENSKYLL